MRRACWRRWSRAWKTDETKSDRHALAEWWRHIEGWRAKQCLRFSQDMKPGGVIKPQYAIGATLRDHARVATRDFHHDRSRPASDVGRAALPASSVPNRWMTSGGLGTMGYGLPAAMGVQIAHPDALVIDIAGEASILMNIQEMGTLAQSRCASKDIHSQQPVYGNGAAVAGAAARRALFRELLGGAARLREARGCISRRRLTERAGSIGSTM